MPYPVLRGPVARAHKRWSSRETFFNTILARLSSFIDFTFQVCQHSGHQHSSLSALEFRLKSSPRSPQLVVPRPSHRKPLRRARSLSCARRSRRPHSHATPCGAPLRRATERALRRRHRRTRGQLPAARAGGHGRKGFVLPSIESIPLRASAATGSGAPGSYVGHSKFPSPGRGYLPQTHPIFDAATALHPAVDMLEAAPTGVAGPGSPVLLSGPFLTAGFLRPPANSPWGSVNARKPGASTSDFPPARRTESPRDGLIVPTSCIRGAEASVPPILGGIIPDRSR